MKNIKLIIISLGLLWVLPASKGQVVDPEAFGYYNEALLFSQTQIGGTARIQALGGAQVALGGDISTVLSNPAGLGLYNRSEFSITPLVRSSNVDASFLGRTSSDNRTNFNLGSLGIVFHNSRGDNSGGFRGGSFGISMTRINDFNYNFVYQGFNLDNSIIDSFIEQADGLDVSQFDDVGALNNTIPQLAYFNYLISPDEVDFTGGDPDLYFSDILWPSFPDGDPATPDRFPLFTDESIDKSQMEIVQARGSQSQWTFAWGGNYDDKLYFGAGLGLVALNYRISKRYTESDFIYNLFDTNGDPIPFNPPISSITLDENLEINGTGINGTFGLILRPVDAARFGVSLITPTYYAVDDIYDASLTTTWNNYLFGDVIEGDTVLNGTTVSETDILISEYNLTTPLKVNVGGAFFLGKSGFITADVEFIDYKAGKLSSDLRDFSMAGDNRTIDNLYTNVVNYRAGAEFRFDIFRLRGGFAYYSDPFDGVDFDRSRIMYSGGLGVRLKNFYADLTVAGTQYNDLYQPYTLSDGTHPTTDLENTNVNSMLTFGFSF